MLSRPSRTVQLAVLVLATVYAVYFSAVTCIGHLNFHTFAYDLGTFDQGIWLVGSGHEPFVTVRGLHLLGDHVRLFSYVLAPLYWIWDDVRALLVLQSVAIAAGALFLCRISLREMPERPWLALVIAAGYLLHPAVQNLNLDHAHPDAFAQTFLLASVDFLRAGRLLPFSIAAALAMSCKEDVPLVFVMMGIALMLDRRQRRLGLAIAGVAGIYFAACMFVILPHFNDVGFFRARSRGFLAGFGEHGSDPLWLLQRVFSPEGWTYLWSIGAPHAFLFLLAPRWLLPALPALAANLLSDAQYMRSLTYHYHTSIVPFLAVATIDACARLGRPAALARVEALAGASAGLRRAMRALPVLLLLVCALATNAAWSKKPLHESATLLSAWKFLRHDADGIATREMLVAIPDDAVVAADFSLVPHLSHRRFIYMLPNPFQVSYWGISGEKPHAPRRVEYIAIRRTRVRPPVDEAIAELRLAATFERIAGGSHYGLFRRRSEAAIGQNSGCGDWDGDGEVDKDDAERIASAITSKRDCPLRVCDADGDGSLRYSDVLRVIRHTADPATELRCPD